MANETAIQVETKLYWRDYFGMVKARLGIGRHNYRVGAGLYKVGTPDEASPVFVSANYKMSFDILRKELTDMNAWILVLDTRGINVWCAAGKGTFSTSEIVRMVKQSGLERFGIHRELILPQLSAPGVSAHEVLKESGFRVKYGPVRAKDIKLYIDNGKKADEAMRTVTFDIRERLVLTPLEFTSMIKTSIYVVAAICALSLIGRAPLHDTALRALFGATAYFIGLFSGGFVSPLLLPWLPTRSFAVKGAVMGMAMIAPFCIFFREQLGVMTMVAMVLFATAVSSYITLTFTGASTFTSPTGVEKEMRIAIPLQIAAVVLSCVLWIGGAL